MQTHQLPNPQKPSSSLLNVRIHCSVDNLKTFLKALILKTPKSERSITLD